MHIVERVRLLPPTRTLRPAKAALNEETRAGVRRLIALAPVLGETNPQSVPFVEQVMQNLIDAPPDGGGERRRPADDLETRRQRAEETRCVTQAMVRMTRAIAAGRSRRDEAEATPVVPAVADQMRLLRHITRAS